MISCDLPWSGRKLIKMLCLDGTTPQSSADQRPKPECLNIGPSLLLELLLELLQLFSAGYLMA
jgi:hypothetical protein